AATVIGNPQNMLIGQVLELRFAEYLAAAAMPVLLGLAATWLLLAWQSRSGWQAASPLPAAAERRSDEPALDTWQTAKGLAVVAALLAIFVATDWPREVAALTAAGLLLMSRKFHSTKMLGLVDWELLILFIGLFVVNHALERTGLTKQAFENLAALGLSMREQAALFGTTFVLSNLVSNVPAVMLLLPAAVEPFSGLMLALVSTLAGNLLIVGSIANMIVVSAAARQGIRIDWRRHARAGVPVTVATLAIVAGWFAARF
ncbi:MAG TPA: SLC13 family permease, partial [Burkholderiales bacterium]|nr:SLC13 family permease [Burkholderiales bacterium]